ncbi:MAG: hypothetical protein LAT68_06635 [Cyclobacteriaceae bacterium]|nr:hypothetical protein [Cyclobacteriaceae bacterium]MCH8515988.1 hypothetical protein [Cyclobacteriaceae bacterium]
MKYLALISIYFIGLGYTVAQDLTGAWRLVEQDGKKVESEEVVKLYSEGYFAFGAKDSMTGEFLSAGGGDYELIEGKYTEKFDFHSLRPEKIGEEIVYQYKLKGDILTIEASSNGLKLKEKWKKKTAAKDELSGAWVFVGRKNEKGEVNTYAPSARRTVKILAGGRFQWIAFNDEEKTFLGTGGGTYSAIGGLYTEKIDFFSRDNNRVGDVLDFKYAIQDGKWHHSGKSSKGQPIYEIWGDYQESYRDQQGD